MTYYVLCSTNPRDFDGPRVSYWDALNRSWDGYDVATRYDHIPDLPAPEAAGATVTAMPAHGVDLDGFPWHTDAMLGPFRLTHCCAAAVSTSDGPLWCKSCYNEVFWTYDEAPVLGPVARLPRAVSA